MEVHFIGEKMEKDHPYYGSSKKEPRPPFKKCVLTNRELDPLGTDQTGNPLPDHIRQQVEELNRNPGKK